MARSKIKKKVSNDAQVTNNADAKVDIVEVRDEKMVEEEAPDNDVVATRKRVSTGGAEEVVGANGEEKSDDDCEEDQCDHVEEVNTEGRLPPINEEGWIPTDQRVLARPIRYRAGDKRGLVIAEL